MAVSEHDPEKWETGFPKRSRSTKKPFMIRKNGNRFSERIMLQPKTLHDPESGSRFSERIMLQPKTLHDPEKWEPVFGKDHAATKKPFMIWKNGSRF